MRLPGAGAASVVVNVDLLVVLRRRLLTWASPPKPTPPPTDGGAPSSGCPGGDGLRRELAARAGAQLQPWHLVRRDPLDGHLRRLAVQRPHLERQRRAEQARAERARRGASSACACCPVATTWMLRCATCRFSAASHGGVPSPSARLVPHPHDEALVAAVDERRYPGHRALHDGVRPAAAPGAERDHRLPDPGSRSAGPIPSDGSHQ